MRFTIRFVIAALAAILSVGPIGAQYQFTVTDLSNGGNTAEYALRINGPGQVVGYSQGPAPPRAWLWSDGTRIDLNMPGDVQSEATAINCLGVVAGYFSDSLYPLTFKSFVQATNPLGSRTVIPSLGEGYTSPTDINDSGVVVGLSLRAGDEVATGFIYRNGQTTALEPADKITFPERIDNDGRITGAAGTIINHFFNGHATLWDTDGTVIDLGTLNGGSSWAFGLSWPRIVGQSSNGPLDQGRSSAFVWQDGLMSDLGALPNACSTGARAVNSCGQIVGFSQFMDDNGCYTARAFFHDGLTMYDLNDLIPADSGIVLLTAVDINDPGQIVANGRYEASGAIGAFLLTPTGGNAPRGR